MAITIAQTTPGVSVGSGSSLNPSFSNPVTPGNGIVVRIGIGANNISSVVDSEGVALTQLRLANNFGANVSSIYYRSSVTTGGSGYNVTITLTSNTSCAAIADEINGTITAHAGNTKTGNSTTHNTNAITTTTANTIIFAVDRASNNPTAPAGWTDDYNAQNTRFIHNIYTTTQSGLNPGFTTGSSVPYAACIEAFTSTNTGSGAVYNRSVTDTLTITQTLDKNVSLTQSVISTLSLTESISRSQLLSLSDILTFTQTIGFSKYKIGLVLDTIIFSHTINYQKLLNKRIDSNIFLTHIISANYTLHKDINHNLTFTQLVIGYASKFIKNTLTFTQTITANVSKSIRNTLNFTQNITTTNIINRSIHSLCIFAQQIGVKSILHPQVSHNLSFTQSITVYKVIGIEHNIGFTQSIIVNLSRIIKNSIEFVQNLSFNITKNINIKSTINLRQIITLRIIKNQQVTNILAFDQSIKRTKTYNLTITDNLLFSQQIFRERHIVSANNTLNLTQTIGLLHIKNLNVISTLNLEQIVNKQSIYNLNVTSILLFPNSYNVSIGGTVIDVPVLLLGKVQRYTSLHYGTETVILPNPQFGDGEGNTGLFTVRRGWRGKTYTFTKKTNFRKIAYTFHMSLEKSIELRGFIERNNSNLIELRNWKGEIWKVYVMNNPIEFTHTGRWDLCHREKVEVTLDFEGIKLGTIPYDTSD